MNIFSRLFFIMALFTPSVCFGGEISIAVMEFSSKGGIEPGRADALSDLLANQIRAMAGYKVIGQSDIKAALDLEQKKSNWGCADDSCIAEIGGALGVQWVVIGNVTLFGKTYLLNLKVLDVVKVRVITSISRKVSGGKDLLIDGMSSAAKDLISQANKISGIHLSDATGVGANTTGGSDQVETSAPARPSNKIKMWGHVTFWSGLGLCALGALSAGVAASKAKIYQDETETRETRLDAMKTSETAAGLAGVGLVAGGALMIAGVVLWVVAPSDTELAATPVVSALGDGSDGVVFGLSGRW